MSPKQYVWLGNSELDLKIWIFGLPIEHKIWKRIIVADFANWNSTWHEFALGAWFWTQFEIIASCKNSSFKRPEFHNLWRYTIFKLVAWQYIVYALMQMWRCFLPAKNNVLLYLQTIHDIDTALALFMKCSISILDWKLTFRCCCCFQICYDRDFDNDCLFWGCKPSRQ